MADGVPVPADPQKQVKTRSDAVCPACGGGSVVSAGTHEYASTFHRWGMDYKDILQWLPIVAEAPQVYPLHRCESCELVFTSIYPDRLIEMVEASECYEEKIIAPYLASMQPFVDESLAEKIASGDAIEQVQEIHWNRLLGILKANVDEVPRIAEIGSCFGGFARLISLTLRPSFLLACETNPKFHEELRKRYPMIATTTRPIEEWTDSGKFDLIYCSDVIEHIWDFKTFLRTVSQQLAADGRLVVVTPNIECAAAKEEGTGWWGYLVPHHCQLFSAEALKAAVLSSGLQFVEATPSFQELVVVFRKNALAR